MEWLHKRPRRGEPGRFLTVLLIAVFLTGCQNVENYVAEFTRKPTEPRINHNVGPKLAPAPLPRYVVGESFRFDDGRQETVLAIDGELVTWRKNRFSTAVGYPNFLIPSLSWQTRTRKSRIQLDAQPGMLWPLRVGNDQRFNMTQVVEAKGDARLSGGETRIELKRSWRCVVERTETVTVPAGTFDTYRISCFRYEAGTDNWRQTRIFHYAPKIAHFVSREDIYASRPGRRIRLSAAGFNSTVLPRAEQISLMAALQDTLNRNPDNRGTDWRSGNLVVTLAPIRTYRNTKGVRCREYTSTYHLGGRKRANFRRVCPNPKGIWQPVR